MIQMTDQHAHRDASPIGHYNAFGYRAATRMSEMGYAPSGGTADRNIRQDRKRLVQMSRALSRDNWLYGGALRLAGNYILGMEGFRLEARSDVPGVNQRIEQELWPEFTADPEVRGLFDWRGVQGLCLNEGWEAGDTLFLKLGDSVGKADAGKLQHVESERLESRERMDKESGNRIEQGVILNDRGQITGFKVAGVDKNSGFVQPQKAKTRAAKDAIYWIATLARSSQTRGVPVATASMPLVHRLEDILTSEAVAWQMMSRLAVMFNRAGASQRPPIRSGTNAESRTDPQTVDIEKLVTEVGYSLIFQGEPGDTLTGVTQNRPAKNFEQSVKLFVRMFGVPLGMPMEMILQDWGNLNFSSSRAVLLQAFLNFRVWQRWLASQFHSRVYRWQIGRWVAQGRLAWRPSILDHKWIVPSWPWIDEDKEVSAWAKKMDHGLATQDDALGALSLDRNEFLTQRKREIEEAWKTAVEIEESTGGAIPAKEIWPTLAGMGPGKTEQAMRAANDDDGAPEDNQGDKP